MRSRLQTPRLPLHDLRCGLLAVELEVFDAEGTSLGPDSRELENDRDVSIRDSKYDKISALRIQAVSDGHTIGNLEFWVDCPL